VDPQSRERIYEMLAALQASGVSVVLTTHHLEEAERRCQRILIIDRGAIVAGGTLEELVRTTLGEARVVSVVMDAPWPDGEPVLESTRLGADRRTLQAGAWDLSAQLPPLFQAISQAGRSVVDVKLTGATLHEVFIALTGRELRE
jgi:ABC-2 type transport system ATP-binding protein